MAVHGARIETALIDPGKPWQNATDESFNGKFRDEHLSLQWFRHPVEARVGIEQWRRHYNEVRPHSSLGYLTPLEFKRSIQMQTPNIKTVPTSAVLQPSLVRRNQAGQHEEEPVEESRVSI